MDIIVTKCGDYAGIILAGHPRTTITIYSTIALLALALNTKQTGATFAIGGTRATDILGADWLARLDTIAVCDTIALFAQAICTDLCLAAIGIYFAVCALILFADQATYTIRVAATYSRLTLSINAQGRAGALSIVLASGTSVLATYRLFWLHAVGISYAIPLVASAHRTHLIAVTIAMSRTVGAIIILADQATSAGFIFVTIALHTKALGADPCKSTFTVSGTRFASVIFAHGFGRIAAISGGTAITGDALPLYADLRFGALDICQAWQTVVIAADLTALTCGVIATYTLAANFIDAKLTSSTCDIIGAFVTYAFVADQTALAIGILNAAFTQEI